MDAAAKNEATLRAYGQFSVDVANLSSHDLRFISRLMSKDGFARNATTYPILRRLVAANTGIESPGLTAPQPYTVRNIRGRGRTARAFRVAFIGLTEPDSAPPYGFTFSDPVEAARRTVVEARRGADFIIALARMKTLEAVKIAREVPDIDAMIVGNGDMFTPPLTIGKTLVAFTPYETRALGEIRVYGNATNGFRARPRYIALDGAVPDDPAASGIAAAASSAEAEARSASKTLLNDWLSATRGLSFGGRRATSGSVKPGPYSSAGACAECHAAQYIKWGSGRHAHATDSLAGKEHDFDASCLDCHASGASASADAQMAQKILQGVQCEECHGPGRDHALKPDKAYGNVGAKAELCSRCHTVQASPKFELRAYWERIRH